MAKRAKPVFFEIALNVLGYKDKEENEWVALALEMDLRGYGSTWEEALSELNDLVFAQIHFAHFKRRPEMIFRPADPVWFHLFADSRRAKLESEQGKSDYLTGGLSIPDPHVIAQSQGDFTPTNV